MRVALFLAFFCCGSSGCCCSSSVVTLRVSVDLFLSVGGVGLTKDADSDGAD